MNNKDSLQRILFEHAPIRGEFIFLHETYQTIINQHPYPPALRRLLGEALCVVGLLSAIIKFDGRLSVQFRGDGQLKLLLAQCDNHFHMRALAKWEGELSYNELMHAFNDGVLVIMLDSGMKSCYQGIVSWRGDSLVDSIEGYFRDSEQLVTKIWLHADDQSAAGFLLQVIPGMGKDISLEKEVIDPHWGRIIQLSSNLNPEIMLKVDFKTLLNTLYPEEDIRIFPSVPVMFQCTCSRKRGEDAILLLGKEEAEAELQGKKNIIVTCDFCNKEYLFDNADVKKMFADKDNSMTQLH